MLLGAEADALDPEAAVEEAGADALEEAEAELEAAVVDAGAEAAVLAHWQTALAEDWTARPVSAPQACTTQPRAAEAMAADWEALHWQPKSVGPQPTPLPAERMHDCLNEVSITSVYGRRSGVGGHEQHIGEPWQQHRGKRPAQRPQRRGQERG